LIYCKVNITLSKVIIVDLAAVTYVNCIHNIAAFLHVLDAKVVVL